MGGTEGHHDTQMEKHSRPGERATKGQTIRDAAVCQKPATAKRQTPSQPHRHTTRRRRIGRAPTRRAPPTPKSLNRPNRHVQCVPKMPSAPEMPLPRPAARSRREGAASAASDGAMTMGPTNAMAVARHVDPPQPRWRSEAVGGNTQRATTHRGLLDDDLSATRSPPRSNNGQTTPRSTLPPATRARTDAAARLAARALCGRCRCARRHQTRPRGELRDWDGHAVANPAGQRRPQESTNEQRVNASHSAVFSPLPVRHHGLFVI